MNRIDLYYKTIDTLREAWEANEVSHAKVAQCPIGLMCAPYLKEMGIDNPLWTSKFITTVNDGKAWYAEPGERIVTSRFIFTSFSIRPYNTLPSDMQDEEKVMELIARTGYTQRELADLEHAFEAAPGYNEGMNAVGNMANKQWLYDGMVAFVDKLGEIHMVDTEITSSSKAKFVLT